MGKAISMVLEAVIGSCLGTGETGELNFFLSRPWEMGFEQSFGPILSAR